MELINIKGGSEDVLNNKGYIIGVGISLGNKWFSVDNILDSIKWALRFSKKEVVVYVADSIHSINLIVRSRKSQSSALRIALKEGEELFEKIKEKIKELDQNDIERLVFVKWDEIVDEKFSDKLSYLRSRYEEKGVFQDAIHKIVRNHTAKEDRYFSDEDIHALGSYIIEELPECLTRVSMKGIVVDAYMYPNDNSIVELVEKIQKGDIFPEIRDRIMDTEPKVLLVVR
jgi:tRNA-dependent cyclodipeptide synthase